MANVNPLIFKAYDIRGRYESEIDSAFALELGNKVVTALHTERIVVGRDHRDSSIQLSESLIEGCRKAGANVIDLGECSTPLFYFMVNFLQAAGGIMITASHNDESYCGFKVVGLGAQVIGGKKLMEIFEQTMYQETTMGELMTSDGTGDYVEQIVKSLGASNLVTRVSYEGPPATEKILSALAEKTGSVFLKESGAAPLHAKFDSDDDRIQLFENGAPIEPDFLFLLLVEKFGFKKVVYDLRFSRSVKEKLGELGIEAVESKVGRLNFYEVMSKNDVDFGGEMSGHFYFKDFHYWESPELVVAGVLKIMDEAKQPLSSLIAGYKKYFKSAEVNIPVGSHQEAMEKIDNLKKKYKGASIKEIDGVTIEYPNWWCNVRPSNTEQLLRIVCEADGKETLDQKLTEVQEAIK